MTTRLGSRHLLLTTGMALLLGACGAASTPAVTSAPSGSVASAPSGSEASAPTAEAATSQPSPPPVVAGSTGPGGGAIADPCSLLTQAEVDAAVGQPLGQGKSAIAHLDCTWSSSDFGANVYLTVGDWATTIKEAASGNGGAPTAIAGLGDEAWTASGNNGSLVFARKGNNGFLLIIDGPKVDSLPDHGVAQEKVLAAAILGRL